MTKLYVKLTILLLVLALCAGCFAGCADGADETTQATVSVSATEDTTASEEITEPASQTEENTTASESEEASEEVQEPLEPGIYLNGHAIAFAQEGDTELDLLSVENGITIEVVAEGEETVFVNSEEVADSKYIDIAAITGQDVIQFDIVNAGQTVSHTVKLWPSTFPSYTTEGESKTAGDFYLSTYDLDHNYLFKLNNQGDLIFYKAIRKLDADGNEVNTNGLDFRKQYTSDGKVRYTYMPYLADAFAGSCSGINPGSVVVMDENYNVIDEVFYQGKNGEDIMIDPHGFLWIDEGHYVLTAYEQIVVDAPEDLGATDNKVDLAVLLIQEVKDGEVLWEFSSADYPQFLYESNSITWAESTDRCYDYVHFNSMSFDADGNLLVSCRHLDAILKISTEDGSLIWQLGGDYDDFGLTEEQKFSYQHSIILTGDNSYMLFDNANTANEKGNADASSVVRITVDEATMSVTNFVRYEVVDFFSLYMGAIRELDHENAIYLWSVGGNYMSDFNTPPAWSMVEYTEVNGAAEYNFSFRYNYGSGRLYCSNKCE